MNPHDQRHVTAAEGYAELGMLEDANDELEKVTSEIRDSSEVLAVRVEIYRGLKRWELLQVAAQQMALRHPDQPGWHVGWAYATRRFDCIESARIILLIAVEHHPEVAILHYNLACYECQLGDMAAAKLRLGCAFELDKRYRLMALEDDDLEPLWDALEAEP